MDNYRAKQTEDTERCRYHDNFFGKNRTFKCMCLCVYRRYIVIMEHGKKCKKNKLITWGYWEGNVIKD